MRSRFLCKVRRDWKLQTRLDGKEPVLLYSCDGLVGSQRRLGKDEVEKERKHAGRHAKESHLGWDLFEQHSQTLVDLLLLLSFQHHNRLVRRVVEVRIGPDLHESRKLLLLLSTSSSSSSSSLHPFHSAPLFQFLLPIFHPPFLQAPLPLPSAGRLALARQECNESKESLSKHPQLLIVLLISLVSHKTAGQRTALTA